jgi:capsular polysaccharide biosynthesis protein
MSQKKAVDLRRSVQIVRRHKFLVVIVVILGIVGGAAYAVLRPPMLTATALVALQPPVTAAPTIAASGTTDTFTPTQEIVAGSNRVLSKALSNVHPAMSLDKLRLDVKIGSPSADLISVSAQGKNAADAEATANAVANSYIRYVTSTSSAVGRIQAQLLEAASEASGPKPIENDIVYGLLGGLLGALIGVIVALAVGRDDRRLRERDGIANSIGIPVLASVPVAHPSAAAGWTKLFESYKPTSVHSWQLRTVLRHLEMSRPGFGRFSYDSNGSSSYNGDRASTHNGDAGPFSLTVLSLSSDSGALALGPQLAVFAASQGISTALVIGPQQDTAGTATLRTACAASASEASTRHGMLQFISYDVGGFDLQADTALVVVIAVVDSRAPKMPDTMRTSTTVIGVSAGAATAEQLARAALVAGAGGQEIIGILVADPDPADQTTGRIPQLGESARRPLPNRLRGVVTEIKR